MKENNEIFDVLRLLAIRTITSTSVLLRMNPEEEEEDVIVGDDETSQSIKTKRRGKIHIRASLVIPCAIELSSDFALLMTSSRPPSRLL